MKLTREEALKLHRQMWSDMQRDLGDKPNWIQRVNYKRKWLRKHFPKLVDAKSKDDRFAEIIRNSCFLCEYADAEFENCVCLIEWPRGKCESYAEDADESDDWRYMPISKLLALPEREDVE